MNFFKKYKNSMEKDKTKHYILGVCSGIVFIVIEYWGTSSILYWPSLVGINVVGFGIEYIQSYSETRHVEANDAYATIAGGVNGILIALIIIGIVHMLLNV
jgi:hypothetical protein